MCIVLSTNQILLLSRNTFVHRSIQFSVNKFVTFLIHTLRLAIVNFFNRVGAFNLTVRHSIFVCGRRPKT